mgnify:CR=1 FL=1
MLLGNLWLLLYHCWFFFVLLRWFRWAVGHFMYFGCSLFFAVVQFGCKV